MSRVKVYVDGKMATLIKEAPINGKSYVREDEKWKEAVSFSGDYNDLTNTPSFPELPPENGLDHGYNLTDGWVRTNRVFVQLTEPTANAAGDVWVEFQEGLPDAPSDLVALINGDNHDLTWTDNSINETGFRIEVNIASGGWETAGSVGPGVEVFTNPKTQILFEDNFIDADGTLLTAHTPDIDVAGNGWEKSANFVEPDITSNAVTSRSTDGDGEGIGFNTGKTSFDFELYGELKTFVTNAQGLQGLFFSMTEPFDYLKAGCNGYYCGLYNQQFRFYKSTNGSLTQVDAVAYAFADNEAYTLKVSRVGNTYTCDLNDGDATLEVTDSDYDFSYFGAFTWYISNNDEFISYIKLSEKGQADEDFEYRVIAVDGVGDSDPSNTAVPEATGPPVSANLLVWLDPTDNSTMWQDVAKTIPVTTDGDPIAVWEDKSGNNNHFTQSDNARRPTWKTTYVRFQNDWLIGPDLSSHTAGSMASKLQVDNIGSAGGGTTGGAYHFSSANTSSTAAHWAFSNTNYCVFSASSRFIAGAWSGTLPGLATDEMTFIQVRSGGDVDTYIDGVFETAVTVGLGNLGSAPVIGGTRRSSDVSAWAMNDMKQYGFVLYDDELTALEAADVHDFLVGS